MAGIKGRSGPPGNLNSVRSVLPALRRLRNGKPLPPELARVAALADQEAELLIADKGGLSNMTGGERLMLNVWRSARQAVLLILTEMVDRGAVSAADGKWDLQPGTQRLAKFLSEERSALLALGLARKTKDAGSLEELLHDAANDTEPGDNKHVGDLVSELPEEKAG